MSNIFTKNNLSDIFKDLTSSDSLSGFMSQQGGATGLISSESLSGFMSQKNASFTTTSDSGSVFMPQKGGSSKLSQVNKNTDEQVNQLISMLTSESEDTKKFNTNSTSTEELENKLRNMLQNGGEKHKSLQFDMKKQSKYQKGGNTIDNESTEELKKRLNVILNDSTTSDI